MQIKKVWIAIMEELSLRELLALKEIHLASETSDKYFVRKFVEQEIVIVIEIGNMLLTNNGRKLLVRGSPAMWDIAT